ncbi:MAG TPA: hypothetical protein VGV41_03395 [Pseudolabrys sp.]|jgi:hypothetical protein|uniref:hypothetical protein n=1 Tax=Pseudolabrys sp. TaxID=1960880 RepID=UPI002DDCBDE3|nr:hypothetical protein [Pseudolabrys sp.]HEV2627671.1 hypothetical protein [Pseudolabrys sp.]
MDARTEDKNFDNFRRRLSPQELDALMRANDHKKATAYVPAVRPRSKAAEAQDGYRVRQQAKARDQFNVTTTTDPLKRDIMRRCIQTIEYDQVGAAALEAVLDDPTIAELARQIRSRRRPGDTANDNNNPGASGQRQVTDLVHALLDDASLRDLVHDLLECDRAAIDAVAQTIGSPHGPQVLSRVNELDEEEFAGLLRILNHHQRGPLLKHCAHRGIGMELLIGIYHPEAPDLGRKLQELPALWQRLFRYLTRNLG